MSDEAPCMTYSQFLEELRKTKDEFKWGIGNRSGGIRGMAPDGLSVCPVTAVACRLTSRMVVLDVSNAYYAGQQILHMDGLLVSKIIHHADYGSLASDRQMYLELRQAVGLA